jgi:hypothetical protein
VQPTIQQRTTDGEVFDYPKIVSVPVVFPRSRYFSLTYPIEKDDTVLLVFTERSMDRWLRSGGTVDPRDPRRHDLTDAVAIPGLYPFSEGTKVKEPSSVEIQYKEASITIKANGDIEISGGDAVKKLVTEAFKDVFDKHAHNYVGAPSGTFYTTTPFILTTPPPPPPLTTPAVITDAELTGKVKAE